MAIHQIAPGTHLAYARWYPDIVRRRSRADTGERSALIWRPRTAQRSVHGSLPASVSESVGIAKRSTPSAFFEEPAEFDFRGCTLLCICPSACGDPESRWCDSNDLRTS